MGTTTSKPPFDGDCCCELEMIVDSIITLINMRWIDEKERCGYRTMFLPPLNEQDVFFGTPAMIPGQMAVAVRGDTQRINEDEEIRVQATGVGNLTCPALDRNVITIRWWYTQADVQEAHRYVMRMGEVIKRILRRNPQLVIHGSATVHKAWPEEIDFNTEVLEAFTGDRVQYPTGSMRVIALCPERFGSEVI